MNYLVITPMPNGKYLVQVMNETQYNALKRANVIDENATIYQTEADIKDIAQSGILGMHSEEEIKEYVKDEQNEITYIEGPPFNDETGDSD